MSHRYLPGSNIEDHFRDKERIETWPAISRCKIHDFLLESAQAAYAAGENNSYPVMINIILRNAGITNRLVAGCQCGLSEPVNLTRLLLFEEICRFKTF